jgi:hypothetical protein
MPMTRLNARRIMSTLRAAASGDRVKRRVGVSKRCRRLDSRSLD